MEQYNKLDIAAKLFPSVTNKNNSAVFRVAVILKEEVDPYYLQLAVNMIYERYSLFFLRMRRGVFWNYFDKNYLHFTVQEDANSPCNNIISYENKGYIIKVLYYKNRISVEAFHSVTDGSGIIEFIKSLVYYYICAKGEQIEHENKVLRYNEIQKNDTDSFMEHFGDIKYEKQKNSIKSENAFRIRGKKFKTRGNCVVTGVVSVSQLKSISKKYDCTITALIIAGMIIAIYEQKQKKSKDKKPIVVAVPVNLRSIFHSRTLKNFFGVVNVGYKMTEQTSIRQVITSVTEQLKLTSDQAHLEGATIKNVQLSKNLLSTYTPLILKNVIMPIGFNFMGELKKTISISNIGRVDMPKDMKPYIEHMEVLVYPTVQSPINCGICSFEDKLAISFTRAITDVSIIKAFFTTLGAQMGVEVAVYSNDWGVEYEKM